MKGKDCFIRVAPELHKAIKIIAAREARTINGVTAEALADYIKKKSKTPEPKKVGE